MMLEVGEVMEVDGGGEQGYGSCKKMEERKEMMEFEVDVESLFELVKGK